MIRLMLFWFLCPVAAFSQLTHLDYNLIKYGMSNDYPFHTADFLYQDAKGQLVFLMGNYAQTFDGHHIEKIEKFPPGNKILYIDEKHIILRTSNSSIVFSDGDLHQSIDLSNHKGLGKIYGASRSENGFSISGDLGCQTFTLEDSLVKDKLYPNIGDGIINVHQVKDTFYVKSRTGAYYFLENQPNVKDTIIHFKLSQYENQIKYRKNGRIICRNASGDTLIPKNTFLYTFLAEGDRKVIAHFIDKQGTFWFSSTEGEYDGLYYILNDQIHSFTHLSIPSAIIADIIQDTEGHLWLGTKGGGLIQMYKSKINVLNSAKGLASNNVISVAQKRDSSFYLSYNCEGIDRINKRGEIVHLNQTNCQRALYVDYKDQLWVAEKGISILADDDSKINFSKPSGLKSTVPKVIFEDSQNRIWVGTRKVLHLFDNDRFIQFPIEDLGEHTRIFDIEEIGKDSLLLAAQDGSYYYFSNGNSQKIATPDLSTTGAHKDLQGNIWISFIGDGLYNFLNGKIAPHPQNKLLPQDIRSMQHDDLGNLWGVTGDNRVYKINLNSLQKENTVPEVHYFTKSDGVPLIATNSNHSPTTAKLHNGKLILPNIYGAIMIDPTIENPTHQKINLKLYQINQHLLDDSQPVKLPLGERSLQVTAYQISLNPNKDLAYRYRLNGSHWQSILDPNNIFINDLSPGHHNLEIGVKHKTGDWWPETQSFQIFIPYKLYEKLWCQFLIALTLVLLLYALYKWRTRALVRSKKLLKEIVDKQTVQLLEEKNALKNSLANEKKLVKDLNLIQESKNRMFARISHEFKSPLQIISSFLHNKNQDQESTNRVMSNVKKMIRNTDEMMELSKARDGQLVINPDWYNLSFILQEQIDLLIPLANKKQIRLVNHIDANVYAQFDLYLMPKVLYNLILNAIKYSHEKNEVIIVLEKNQLEKKCFLKIIDHGIGIPENEIELITESYFEASNNPSTLSSGIGLSLVKEILTLHNTTLLIESQKNKGSTFGFYLPALEEQQVLNRKQESSDLLMIDNQLREMINPNKPVVLIIDDNEDILFFISKELSKKYYVLKAINGQDALEIIKIKKPDFIISDIMMPNLNGMELLKIIRSDEKLKMIPFIFLTGSVSEEVGLLGLSEGSDQVLTKPIQIKKLQLLVDKMLQRDQLIQNHTTLSLLEDILPSNISTDDRLLIKKLDEYLMTNMSTSELNNKMIANYLGVGERTLRDRVKKILGVTIKEYLHRLRLENAKLLIQKGQFSLSEIAHATGFSSLSYFSTAYKKYFGFPPSADN